MNLMLPDSGLLFWMTIIFLIVFFVLAKFGFPIITGMVEKRNKRISDSLEAARIAEDAIAHLTEEQERIISETRASQAKLMQEAAAERDMMIAQAQDKAREEAQKVMDEVAKLSMAIAEQVIRKELSSDDAQKALVDKLLNEVKELHNEHRTYST